MSSSSGPASKRLADIDRTTVRRFPLVHQLIHFADLRNVYRDMREALITANRRAGAQQGLVTKAKNKIARLEAEMTLLEQERDDLLTYRQQVEAEASQISALLPRLKGRLLQVQQIEQALAEPGRHQGGRRPAGPSQRWPLRPIRRGSQTCRGTAARARGCRRVP
jgi:chromosome segregation ATPase